MGVSKKIELSKIQYNHVVMIIGFVPIIAPPQSKRYRKRFFKSLSGFTPGLLSPETDALKFHALIAEPRHQNYHHGQ
ncbi:TPA: hypothetical protein MCM60_005608 [Klebsiella pneumoniae]|jgi:hypothetical protein|uniref:hypothetical protein n=1 Tax=Klebsiella TaxID=570 RepID=UPI000A86389B|nr:MULTISPECIES: hypothetical protein [Klebsiella]HDT5529529.1 hypothetical protein [Klebsiella pneumoniae subsp. ozaenae]EIV5828826.1 hypothetical protein [Klebsiella pneumoniae]EKV4373274.1 hypothetical protein [Klebsiella pneumoniae]EKW2074410.1 hypothetical protein [Klebsiella pneumoniae]EKW2074989.1 hypothetical protein [Klebsiella pneumoniae]